MTRRHLLTAGKIVLALGLIAYVVNKAGWSDIRHALANMNPNGWLVGLALTIVAHVVSMLRWHVLMVSVKLHSTPWIALRLGFIGVFFSNVVPGLTGGDLVKAFYVARENRTQRAGAVVSVAMDRIIGIVALALIAAVVVPFDLETYREAAAGIYGFLLATGVVAILTLSRRVKTRLRALVGRLPATPSTAAAPAEAPPAAQRPMRFRERLLALLGKADEAVSTYRDRLGTVGWALLISVAVHLLIIVALQFFAQALAQGGLAALAAEGSLDSPQEAAAQQALLRLRDLPLLAYCSIVPIIMIISALPIAPAGWGVGEVAFVHFFATAGIAQEHAVALSLTYRVTAVLVSLIGGLFLIVDRRRVLEAAERAA